MVGGRFFRCLLPCRRFWKSFVYTLPITIYPLIYGTLYGLLWTYFQDMQYHQNIDTLMFEAESDSWMNAFSLPGIPGIHDVPVAPFYLPTLLNSNWYKRLNLTKPAEDVAQNAGVDRAAVLEDLSQEINPHDSSPTSHWVFVTSMPWLSLPWDVAFDQLVQYHYIHPPARNASLSYVDCARSGFLCGIWNVQPPAMLHFAVEGPRPEDDDPLPEAFSWRAYPLKPVTIRVVELGLETFKRGMFPSEFDQLLFLTSGEYSFDSLEEYSAERQQERRFNNWFDLKLKEWSLLDALYGVDVWIQDMLGEDSPILSFLLEVRQIFFLIVTIGVQGPIVVARKLWWAVESGVLWFLGTDSPVDPSADFESLLPGSGAGGQFWDAFFAGGIAKVAEGVGEAIAKQQAVSASEAAKAAVTSF